MTPAAKTGQDFLYPDGDLFFQEKDHCRSQRCAQKRDQDSLNDLNIHI
jgi:hypothetical protein